MWCDVTFTGLLQIVCFTLIITLIPIRGASLFDGRADAYYSYDDVNAGEVQSEEDDVLRQRRRTRSPNDITVKEGEVQIGADSGSEYEYDGPRNESYQPHHGFEMYWPDGDWVFPSNYIQNPNLTTIRLNYTTTRDPANKTRWFCGRECPPKYIEYGPICARNGFGNKQYDFENYCEFYQQDCERGRGWYIAYRGRCDRTSGRNKYPQHEVKDGPVEDFVKDRAEGLLYDFMKSSPSTLSVVKSTATIAAFAGVDEDSDSEFIDEFENANRTLTEQEQMQKEKIEADKAAKQKFKEAMSCYILP